MTISVNALQIDGLHDRISFNIPIKDNRLVLVGENGTGKSTVVNILYFFLTRQWERLLSYRFASITVTVNEEQLQLTREQLAHAIEPGRIDKYSRRVPSGIRSFIEHLTLNSDWPDERMELELRRFVVENDFAVPMSAAIEYYRYYKLRILEESPTSIKQIKIITERLGQWMTERVLFLPTYRRIEQELHAIFRGASAEMKGIVERAQEFRHGRYHVELVAFGMEDVVGSIEKKMATIKENLRTELNALTGSYLRDVIQGIHNNVSYESVQDLDDNTLESIFKRLDEQILPVREKERLREIVRRIHEEKKVSHSDRVVAHFLTKLHQLHTKQETKESDIRAFVDVCNGYLAGKRLQYDDVGYTIKIFEVPRDLVQPSQPANDERALQFGSLSSGEKQIVSLFSHIYLSDAADFFVIIDEPELSLSVPWQKKFLPDIIKTNKCSGLVAVTHSPFISDNDLDTYTHSISEFAELTRVLP